MHAYMACNTWTTCHVPGTLWHPNITIADSMSHAIVAPWPCIMVMIHGTVTVSSDGHEYKLNTFQPVPQVGRACCKPQVGLLQYSGLLVA